MNARLYYLKALARRWNGAVDSNGYRGMGYTRFPLTPALSPGERENVHRLAITRVPEFAQKLSANHQSDVCRSLSLVGV